MAQRLGNVPVGQVVKLKENGSPVNYLVVHQGRPSSIYDASCNGTCSCGRTLLKSGSGISGTPTFWRARISTRT